jgi:hypothetical protein
MGILIARVLARLKNLDIYSFDAFIKQVVEVSGYALTASSETLG